MTEVRRLVVAGRYENIPTITSFVGEAALAAGLGETGMFHCQMAVDEACTNVIEHAYGGEGIGDIEITCSVEPGVCTIQIVDQGQPFDPDSVPAPKISTNLEDVKPGGIGLHLMRQLMDDVRFSFGEQGNVLVMVKKRPVTEGKPQEPADIRTASPEVGMAVVSPEGRLDSSAGPRLEKTLLDLLLQGTVWLVVDMAGVSYISSRGLKALVTGWRNARSTGGDVLLCALQPPVLEIFETVGFTQIFDVFGTREEALAAVATRRAGSAP